MIPDLASNELEELIRTHEGLLLVDFYSPSCSPCHRLLPVIEELAAEFPDSLHVVKCDAAKHGEMAAKYKVNTVPNLLLFRKGELLSRRVGATSSNELRQWIQSSL